MVEFRLLGTVNLTSAEGREGEACSANPGASPSSCILPPPCHAGSSAAIAS